MKTMVFAAMLLGASAVASVAQTTTTTTDAETPAVATPSTKNPTALVPGHNSFTEAQAKERIEKAG